MLLCINEKRDDKACSLGASVLRKTGSAGRDTNCDIFSWVSSQLAVCCWNMAAMAAASSSFVMLFGLMVT